MYHNLIVRYNKSGAQILIRWCIQRGFVCIPKSVKESRIRENSDVFDFSISEDDITAMVRKFVQLIVIPRRTVITATSALIAELFIVPQFSASLYYNITYIICSNTIYMDCLILC